MWLILLAVFFVGLVFVAGTKPDLLESRLVRFGAALLVVAVGLLAFVPALITGLLFMFSVPIAVLLILVGTILRFRKSDKAVHEDVAALALAAKRTRRVWPDDAPLRQVDQVAKHGLRAGPALVSLLRFESDEQLSDDTWSPHLEQQVELALCGIYGEPITASRTVYDIHATPAENRRVKPFWEARVRLAAD
jgi:hypothetical protein